MAVKKSPFTVVKEQFESKEKLVQAVMKLSSKVFDRDEDEEKDSLQKRLLKVSNRTLLRLHKLGKTVEATWGSKEKLVDDLLAKLNRAKDKDYRSKMLTRSLAWLHDRIGPFLRHGSKEVAPVVSAKPKTKAKTKASEAPKPRTKKQS